MSSQTSGHDDDGDRSGSSILGEELARLVARQGVAVSRVVPVTSIASPVADRAAFRVELADGRSINARRFKSAERAALTQRLLGSWSGGGFPAILATEGRSMLVEWIDGESFAARERAAEDYEACGELLGRLHALPSHAGAGAELAAKAIRWSHRLVERELLSPGEGRGVASTLEATAPVETEIGAAHRDYSAGNLIVDRGGRPVAIDNETLAIAPLDLDLAICERRWPMEDWQRRAFERGYQRHRDLAGYREARVFWHLYYLTRRAALKSRRPGHAEASALAALRGLLDAARE